MIEASSSLMIRSMQAGRCVGTWLALERWAFPKRTSKRPQSFVATRSCRRRKSPSHYTVLDHWKARPTDLGSAPWDLLCEASGVRSTAIILSTFLNCRQRVHLTSAPYWTVLDL